MRITGHLRRIEILHRAVVRWRLFWKRAVAEFARLGSRFGWPGPPVGVFSLNDIEGAAHIVAAGQTLIPAKSGSLREHCGLGQNGQQPWPIFWTHIHSARLIGSTLGVVNDRNLLLAESALNLKYYRDDPAYNILRVPPPIHLEGSWTSLKARWVSYFHWMTDCLPRLAVLDQFPADCGILVPALKFAYQRQTLDLLGLMPRVRETTEQHIIVEDYYFSSFTGMTACDNPYAIKFLRSRFLPLADPDAPTYEKIYIHRKNKTRGIQNDSEVLEFFSGLNWTIVDLEQFTLRQQIQIFKKARIICSQHGAAFANLAYASPGCAVIEMLAENYLNGCFEGMSDYLGLSYRHVIFPADRESRMQVHIPTLKATISDLERQIP